MADPIMEVDMETEDETKGREHADSEAVTKRDAAQGEEEGNSRARQRLRLLR